LKGSSLRSTFHSLAAAQIIYFLFFKEALR